MSADGDRPIPETGGNPDGWREVAPVIHTQPLTRVYANLHGQIVIRQEAQILGDDDPFVFFSPEHLPALIAELQGYLPETASQASPSVTQASPVMPEASPVTPEASPEASHPSPAALRQRRYRHRKGQDSAAQGGAAMNPTNAESAAPRPRSRINPPSQGG